MDFSSFFPQLSPRRDLHIQACSMQVIWKVQLQSWDTEDPTRCFCSASQLIKFPFSPPGPYSSLYDNIPLNDSWRWWVFLFNGYFISAFLVVNSLWSIWLVPVSLCFLSICLHFCSVFVIYVKNKVIDWIASVIKRHVTDGPGRKCYQWATLSQCVSLCWFCPVTRVRYHI